FVCCKTKIDSVKCGEMYEAYFSQRMANEYIRALNSISEAIQCDSINQDYRFEKVKYLISLEKYEEAKKELKNLTVLNSNYSIYFPLSGLIELKNGQDKVGEKELRKVYNSLKTISFNKENFNLFYN